jgi:hypothetical protein
LSLNSSIFRFLRDNGFLSFGIGTSNISFVTIIFLIKLYLLKKLLKNQNVSEQKDYSANGSNFCVLFEVGYRKGRQCNAINIRDLNSTKPKLFHNRLNQR